MSAVSILSLPVCNPVPLLCNHCLPSGAASLVEGLPGPASYAACDGRCGRCARVECYISVMNRFSRRGRTSRSTGSGCWSTSRRGRPTSRGTGSRSPRPLRCCWRRCNRSSRSPSTTTAARCDRNALGCLHGAHVALNPMLVARLCAVLTEIPKRSAVSDRDEPAGCVHVRSGQVGHFLGCVQTYISTSGTTALV